MLARGALGLFGLAGVVACQTFVGVDMSGKAPVFTWRADAPVTGLMVLASESCDAVHGKQLADRIWWQLSGPLKPPVTYGVVPKGVAELAPARPFPKLCGPYTVRLTDPNLGGESATFRP